MSEFYLPMSGTEPKHKNLFISRRETIAQWTIVRKMDGILQEGAKKLLPSKWGAQRHFFNIVQQARKNKCRLQISYKY